ncbi:hypothetical protein EV426DRAFT_667709 [Tirmania nivea]|nr:hypothetical protein EV426DRAFT_667709 [Tirmania nivea]
MFQGGLLSPPPGSDEEMGDNNSVTRADQSSTTPDPIIRSVAPSITPGPSKKGRTPSVHHKTPAPETATMNRLLKQLEAEKEAALRENTANTAAANQTRLSNDTAEALNQIQGLILTGQRQQRQEFETIHNNLNWLKDQAEWHQQHYDQHFTSIEERLTQRIYLNKLLDGYHYLCYYKHHYLRYYKHHYLRYHHKHHHPHRRLDHPDDHVETQYHHLPINTEKTD